jgi:putative component of toxin-antitoxin plasmid stabilization module
MLKERKITKKNKDNKCKTKKRKERIHKGKEGNSETVKTCWREVRKMREEGSKEYYRYR